MKSMDKIQEFLLNDKNQIQLLLYCIENDIDFSYLNLHEETEADLKLLDMSGIINMDYDLKKYVLAKTKVNQTSDIRKHLSEYRAVFSRDGEGKQGLIPGSMGDRHAIIKKLNKWMKNTEFEYSMQQVINTARYYVEDLIRRGDLKYLQNAHYFIEKDGNSRLSSYIDEGKDYISNGSLDLNTSNVII